MLLLKVTRGDLPKIVGVVCIALFSLGKAF